MRTRHPSLAKQHTRGACVPRTRKHTAATPAMPAMPHSLLLVMITLSILHSTADTHGVMHTPNQRGSLGKCNNYISRLVDKRAPLDVFAHFPAGVKHPKPGSGAASQRRAAGRRGWTPFKPMKKDFVWRAGVCGDEVNRRDHLRGGRYYFGGKVVATYPRGGIISLGFSLNAHHNGFFEVHVCNVKKCGGEISEQCFRQGHCRQLKRVWNKHCQSGRAKECGPIDRKYPGRWYLPCSKFPGQDFKVEAFGMWSLQYRLPKNLACEHCVLQWFWSTANTCNPPGVMAYFKGPDRPRWGNCPGAGGARGGVAREKPPCGPRRFPEEYLQCADIRIGGRGAVTYHGKKCSKRPKRKTGGKKRQNLAPIRDVLVLGNSREIGNFNRKNVFRVGRYSSVSLRAVVSQRVRKVEFYVNGRRISVDGRRPFYINGDYGLGRPKPWRGFKYGRRMTIGVKASGVRKSYRVVFRK